MLTQGGLRVGKMTVKKLLNMVRVHIVESEVRTALVSIEEPRLQARYLDYVYHICQFRASLT